METVYLVCFWVGFILTVVLALFGGLFGHGAGGGHGGGHLLSHSAGAGHGHTHLGSDTNGGPSPISLHTVLAFITGFGGIGYALVTTGVLGGLVILLISVVAGLVISWFVFTVMFKLFVRGERVMRQEDYDIVGALGYVSIRIPQDGVGEVKYVMADTTRSTGARTETGGPLEKGTEVVIVGVAKGIAIVIDYDSHVHGGNDRLGTGSLEPGGVKQS